MDKINILNKQGMLTEEDRKAPLERGLGHFTFKSCLDLSCGVDVIPYGNPQRVSIDHYSQDVASFITFWTQFVMKEFMNHIIHVYGNVKS